MQMSEGRETQLAGHAGVARRLAAFGYDSLLVAALWMLVGLIATVLNGGQPIRPGNPWLQFALLFAAATFYVYSWTRAGQTLGMRPWRLKVETRAGGPLTWQQALVRFFAGLFVLFPGVGIGLVWLRIDRDRLAWHDRWSGTRVVVLPKNPGNFSARAPEAA